MSLPKRYNPKATEPRIQESWQAAGLYHFSPQEDKPVFSIDTPPATVSGNLHLGHVYSYSHPDFIARYWRMKGFNVFYPMGYDDNGLPTERLVEKRLQIKASEVGREVFIEKCLQISQEAEKDYQVLWQRLGLSIDWRYTYRTIDDFSRRISQISFIDLYRKGFVYRQEAPAIWCPECRTAIAQAELNDIERQSEYVTLAFETEIGEYLPIATTRPELLPACVAVFVHPDDNRYRDLVGQKVRVPLFGQRVPVLEDSGADPQKGTGAVMCCTFGDSTDVVWWRTHKLPLIQCLGRDGIMTEAAGQFAGLSSYEARHQIVQVLESNGLLLGRKPTLQSVRVHERCDTLVEYIVTPQWFIQVLNSIDIFLAIGEEISWQPEYMQTRYSAWVENLNWDWCISRQRYFGVPFPLWYCDNCGQVILANPDQLPVDPTIEEPDGPCPNCGGSTFTPEQDVFDTWATSSLTPQIVGRWPGNGLDRDDAGPQSIELYEKVFPFGLRPQAHEIIRTWAFYTIVKSFYHFQTIPWKKILISGWGIAGEGMGKISKSRGGGPMPPLEMIERYSADAVRYWAASTSAGKDAIISEEKIQMGAKLVNKLWNVARFSERFLEGYQPPGERGPLPDFTTADRWILARAQRLVRRVSALFDNYDYATAKSETETFFWTEFADNYLEMCKQRLYDQANPRREGALFTLHHVLLVVLKLFAPFLPYVTEEIFMSMALNEAESVGSIHVSGWPTPDPALEDEYAEQTGEILIRVATAARRYKSEHNLPLSAEFDRLQLATENVPLASALKEAALDLISITRARKIEFLTRLEPELDCLPIEGDLSVAIEYNP